jgi:hypothetical protein
VTRTPVLCFVAALIFVVAALNEANLHHWGTLIVLLLIAGGAAMGGIWTLRE